MRHSLTSRLVVLTMALSLAPAGAVFAADPLGPPTGLPGAEVVAGTPAADRSAAATEALEKAQALFEGGPSAAHSPSDGHDHGDDGDGFDRSATLVLDELAFSYDDLDAAQRMEADAIMARPTEADNIMQLDSADANWEKDCKDPRFCIHYATDTDHSSDSAWVARVKATLGEVWNQQIGQFGYRTPLPDGRRGGSSQFDLYLAEIEERGLLGYCAAERPLRKDRTASTFCVLDNDYADTPNSDTPNPNGYLRLAAAHEFFHAVQNAYDVFEDPWMKEASATWMEERFATEVNDNRFFLRYGQVRRPNRPLDRFRYSQGDPTPYGNWPFFEFLSSRYGNGIVKKIWNKAAGPSNRSMSVKAIDRALGKRGGLAKNYARFGSVNTAPWTQYAEGAQWRVKAPITASRRVTKSRRVRTFSTRLKHLTSRNYNVGIRHRGLKGRKWKLTVRVQGPRRISGPGAHLLIHKRDGSIRKKQIKLNRAGAGTRTIRLGRKAVRRVTVTVANGSTRYRCDRSTAWACQGKPLDNGKTFKIRATLRR